MPKGGSKKWKVGYVKTHVWPKAQDYAKQNLAAIAAQIDRHRLFQVEEISWPEQLSESHHTHNTIYVKSLAYYFQQEKDAGTKISTTMSAMIENGNRVTSGDFQAAIEKQVTYCKTVDSLFKAYDFVLSLGTSSSAPLRHETEIPDPSLIWTLCHLPVVAVPTSRCPRGMPYGVQIVSRKWNDYLLLQAVEKLVDQGIFPLGSQKINKLSKISLN
jgi:Asp-tRNA(Asn)/Glu-tRNA(Gln) amidotransferase A subunit family amidase